MATQPFILDDLRGVRRQGKLGDLLRAIVLGDHLPRVRRVSCLVVPGEYPNQAADALSFFLLYCYARKPVFSWMYSLSSARCIIEMAKLVARDASHLRSGELLEYNVETISPLRFAAHSLDIMIECAKDGIPMSCGPMLVMGSSAPMNHLATMVLENAEILATLTLIMVLNPDNPRFDYIAPAHSMNMANGMCSFGNPNQALFALLARQLADFYGFDRVVANCGLSDALFPDYQSGIERAVTLAVASVGGVDETGLMGIAGADQAASMTQLAIDDQFFDCLGRLTDRERGPAPLQDGAYPHREAQPHALSRVGARIADIEERHFPPTLVISDGLRQELVSVLERHLGSELIGKFEDDLRGVVQGNPERSMTDG